MTELPPSLSPRPPGSASAQGPAADGPRVQRSEAGLTAPGVAVVVLAATLVGVLVDRFTVDSGVVFGVAYVASCIYVALQVRRRDLLAAVVVPPLVFFVLTTARALFDPGASHTTSARMLTVASDLATLAPALWIGTALAALIVLVRWRTGVRSAARR